MKPSTPHNELSDWVLGIVAGETRSFRHLYDYFHRDLFRFAQHIVKSEQLAEDIVHDVFVRVWENRLKLDNSLSIKSFLFTICRNLSLNVLEKAATEARIHDEILRYFSELPVEVPLTDDYEKIAQEALTQLPPQRRQVFELAKIEGLSYQQIAQKLNISPGTVSDHIVKANRFLREYVKNNLPE